MTGTRYAVTLNTNVNPTTVATHATDVNYNTYGAVQATGQGFNWQTVTGGIRQFALWQTECGCDGNSTKTATNLNLNIDALGFPLSTFEGTLAGTNLTSVGIPALNSDKAGVARSSTAAWTTGAYNNPADLTPPAPPTGIRVSRMEKP